jgi:hypothetical protein
VDHETRFVSAQDLCDALNQVAFEATVKKDAGKNATVGGAPTFVTSTFKVANTDDNDINTENIKRLLSSFESYKMESYAIDESSKDITVVHNPLPLPLETITAYLEEHTGLKTTISVNGADDITWNFPTLEQRAVGKKQEEEVEEGEATPSPKTTVILSGIFWIVSMVALLVGW